MAMAGEDSDSEDQELFPIEELSASDLVQLFPVELVSSAFHYEDPLLLAAGALRAVVEGDLDKLKTLISNGRSPNINDNNGNTPLHIAVLKQKPEIVDYLLSLEETIVNSRNFWDETALFQAVQESDLRILEKLIRAKADVNIPNQQKVSPLHLSVYNPKIARILIQNGANLDALDDNGETPLHHAVTSSCNEIVSMLLYFNADANVLCDDKITPFMKSIILESQEIQEILLDYVVDFNTTTRAGNTVLTLALTHACPYVKTIIDRGADVNYYTDDTSNALQACLRSPANINNFRLIWKYFEHQEPEHRFLKLVEHLEESDLCQYLRVIIDSDNLDFFFKCFDFDDFRPFFSMIIHSSNKVNWFNIMYELVFLYLSHGYFLTKSNIENLYYLFGYDELLYICLHTDIKFSRNFRLTHTLVDILCHPTMTVKYYKRCILEKINMPLYMIFGQYSINSAKFLKEEIVPHLRFRIKSDTRELEVSLSQVSSLLELARNTTRDYLVKRFKLTEAKHYFSFIDNMPVPKVIKDYLTFRKPIYAIEME